MSETKFACDQCDSKFSRKDNLDRHKMCHVETTLQCSFCKKKFKERQPLIEHEQYHINSKKFQCPICKDKFLDETYFYNHMEKNHSLTKDMFPMINAAAVDVQEKPTKSRRVSDNVQAVLVEPLKVPSVNSQSFDVSSVVTSGIDTLNLSMSVAGIVPTSSAQDLGNINLSSIQTVLNTPTTLLLNQNFSNSHIASNSGGMNMTRNLPQINQSFTTTQTGAIVLGLQEGQRLAIINSAEPDTIRLQRDHISTGLVDNVILHDQQRLIQDALGTSAQNTGFRLENLYQ